MTWDPPYERDDDWILHSYKLATGNVIRFAAKEIRRERTGVHAQVAISMNWVTLAWSNFNVERDEDRVRLANSAFKHLDDSSHEIDRTEFPQNHLKHALDLFCLGLWDEIVGMDIGGMMEGDPNLAPAELILGDYILADAGTILFAPPGSTKSYTALAWAVSCAWTPPTDVWKVHQAIMPLYINVERSERSMRARLARVNAALGLDPHTPIPFINARGKSLADIYEAIKRTAKKEGCRVAFYDSISRAGFGSLTQDDVANRTMDMLNALDMSWVALAHSPRSDDTHAFGSQMFDAAADMTVQLRSQTSSDGQSTGSALEVVKTNDTGKPPLFIHVFEWGQDGLRNIRRGRAGEFVELESSQRRSKEDEAKAFLLRVGEVTAQQVADEFGWQRNHTSSLLSKARWSQSRKQGTRVLYSVRVDGDEN